MGRSGDEPRHLDADLTELRRRLDDPFDHFLGPNYESLILPGRDDEYYGFPPGKAHVFQGLDGHEIDARGFAPLLSYARGGLAEAWTGGSYAFDDRELRDFPFAPEALRAGYARVAERIGITGAADDLQRFFPVPDADHETPPPLDAHAARLLANYESHRERLNARDSFYLGRARLALLGADRGRRRACDELGRCLWGCPIGALWTPSWTLGDLEHHERFEYRPGLVAQRFESDDGGRVQRLVVRPSAGGAESAIDVGTLVLCAGTLATARIVLETARRESGSAPELRGLMDNRQVLMPFVSPKMVGRRFEAASYQYHALACALDLGGPEDYVHGLITTLKTALIHPIVATLPLSMRGSLRYFRNLHAALGLVNVNFSDGPRDDNRVALEGEGAHARLFVRYAPP
ncbi:MAG: hypothetical protein KDB18_13615, partial [Salinibacterium sp.]|nr:hypothetical protein [Salinibacterium sp.]